MPDPTCTISGSQTPADVAASSTVNGALASPAGALFWSVSCTATDETNTAAEINATLSIDQDTKSFSFTSPGVGSACIFTSIVGVKGLGLDANGAWQPAYVTTFKVNVKAANGLRVMAFGEVLEQGPAGWAADVNPAIRSADGGTSSVTGTGFAHVTSNAFDTEARAVDLDSDDITDVLQPDNGGTGLSTIGDEGEVLTVVDGVPAWANPSAGSPGPIRFALTTAASQTSATPILGDSLVGRLRLTVTTPFSVGTTIQIGNSADGSLLVDTGELDAELGVVDSYDVWLDTPWGSDDLVALVTLGGSPSAGAGFLTIYWATPTG